MSTTPMVRASVQTRARSGHRREVLQAVIHGKGASSRATIARATGLTSATVSSIVTELVEAQLVENAGLADSTGGKPATSLRVRTDARALGVIIIRRHSIRAAVVDLLGSVVVEIDRLTSPTVVGVEDVRTMLLRLVDASPLPLVAIGLDSPGAISAGVIIESVQLQMHGVPLRDQLADIAPCEVYLINDAGADALREYTLDPPADGCLLLVVFGVGVGGALVLGGALYPGPQSLAGELGHVRVDFSDAAPECSCGRRGCLERVASLPDLLGLTDDALAASDNPADLDLPSSPEAVARIERATRLTARVIVTVCAAMNLRTVVIGGAAPRLGDGFLDAIQRNCDDLQPIGTQRITLRYATGAVLLPFRGGAEHALRSALGVTWSR